jgi:hypothetical protein
MDMVGTPMFIYNPDISITQGSMTGYYCYDGESSSTLLLDPAGVIQATADYDEYGIITGTTGAWINDRVDFNDMDYSTAIDLYSYNDDADQGINFYDPYTGVDLCPDPDPVKEEVIWCDEKHEFSADVKGVMVENIKKKADREDSIKKLIYYGAQKACEKAGETECIGECEDSGSLCTYYCFGMLTKYGDLNGKGQPEVTHEGKKASTKDFKASCRCKCLSPKEIEKHRNPWSKKK